jgi:pyruvate-ferredoxin/flavodoxin oxidoreductase
MSDNNDNTDSRMHIMDGNEGAADVAFRLSEVCAIYPITPSTTMSELCEEWKNNGRKNLWQQSPSVMEMQSEGGAAGSVHGALQSGALATTFTASQGLMLMIPNMYKIAGELTATVFHVAARSLAAQALSIFGDHQDVMAVRSTGFALLASNSVQQAHDLAAIAHASTLQSRVPFLHFFDGFRTSHEVNKIHLIDDATLREFIKDEWVRNHRGRALNPEKPVIRGTAQNPDVYFQGREASNSFYLQTPDIVQASMDEFARLTGRQYHLYEYYGDEQAERLIILMGSGVATVQQTIDHLRATGEKVGVLAVHLFRPFAARQFLAAIPATVTRIAVLDRTKEPGSLGEPLYLDAVAAFSEAFGSGELNTMPRLYAGRYGLSSKEFTPAMVKAVFDNLAQPQPKNHFTIGIEDDVTHTHLNFDRHFEIEPTNVVRSLFYGLGADGTVGANKNTIKIIGEDDKFFAQAYFVYDSKKSGSQTVSHLRFGPQAIDLPYLIQSANFIGIHQFKFVEQPGLLDLAAKDCVLLINAPYPVEEVWQHLPRAMQQQIIEKNMKVHVINAYQVARETDMGNRINTIMQTCFFALSGVMPREQAIEKIKSYIKKTYAKKGSATVERNFKAVDETLAHLSDLPIGQLPKKNGKAVENRLEFAPDFVQQVTAQIMRGQGDLIPVSQIPVDGTYPSGTTQWEKRLVAQDIPEWVPDVCIQCGNCSMVCPHAAIRAKFYHQGELANAPATFKSAEISARGFPDTRYTLQVYPEDCTGCQLCVQVCPAIDADGNKAINMKPVQPLLEAEKNNLKFFEKLPLPNRSRVDFSTVRGVQFLQPLFEFSSSCAGCGETPYLKLVSQLFGDRMLVANATGCSSIYGGNLPTTPWSKNAEGRGPAWANSLFEDNAEFGLGFRLTVDQQQINAAYSLNEMREKLPGIDVDAILGAPQARESELRQQRARIEALKRDLQDIEGNEARQLESIVDQLLHRSIWIVGGDGWAYDIGYGGLDHVLASGRNVNILVMDTEVYSNTGGQMSKATPLGAVAKFSAGGKPVGKKDLALQAIAYGNVYVARVALGANPQQTLQAMREAEAYPGTSIILAYSHCIAHGINMEDGLKQQKLAVASGHWPLLRYNPLLRKSGTNPFTLDCLPPSIALKDYRKNEGRFQQLVRSQPAEAERLTNLANEALKLRWKTYEDMANRDATEFQPMYE